MTQVTERRAKRDCVLFVESIAAHDPEAQRITLMMDNLNTQASPLVLFLPLGTAAAARGLAAH